MPRTSIYALVAALALLVSGCSARPSSAQALRVQVLQTYPHDPSMYTQGLEITGGVLYEGSGRVGQSRLRAVELSGSRPGRVLGETALPVPLFGEGITNTGSRLWQLTWKNGVAIERDPQSLRERRRVRYQGEGWGLCHQGGGQQGDRLVMSDGSDRLTFRDPVTFAPTGQVAVRLDGEPARDLNELECVNGMVWANVYLTDRILRIDPRTGSVTGVVETGGLLTAAQRAGTDVLNGIAAIPHTDEFLLTGKNWPLFFRVRFSPA